MRLIGAIRKQFSSIFSHFKPVKNVNVQSQREQNYWFDDIKKSKPLSAADNKVATKFARTLILGDEKKAEEFEKLLNNDQFPRLAFLSVSDGETSARTSLGSGNGIADAIKQAKKKLYVLISNQFQPVWIKVDIVNEVSSLGDIEFNTQLQVDRGVQGVAFDEASHLAYLPEEIVSRTYVANDQILRMSNIRKQFAKKSQQYRAVSKMIQAGRGQIYRFTTESFFIDEHDSYPLYRGHRLFSRLSSQELNDSAEKAGEYLINNIAPSGEFIYSYLPKMNQEQETYNLLRHAGTIYSMLELFEVNHDETLLKKTEIGINYLLKQIKTLDVGGEKYSVVVEQDFVKLGGNALACLALAKYAEVTRENEHNLIAKELAEWVLSTQNEQGSFTTHKLCYSTQKIEDFVSDYYPGEAIFALTRFYQVYPDERWLDAAEKAATYLINVRDKNLPANKLAHDHWLLYGLNELHRLRPNDIYITHTQKIVGAIISTQTPISPYKDWVGGYYNPPRSTPTAVRAEGLCAAYCLLRDYDDQAEAEKILNTIKLCLCFQLQTQFRPENTMYLKKPVRALGGFSKSLSNFEIRIDYVQHNLSSVLGMIRIMG